MIYFIIKKNNLFWFQNIAERVVTRISPKLKTCDMQKYLNFFMASKHWAS